MWVTNLSVGTGVLLVSRIPKIWSGSLVCTAIAAVLQGLEYLNIIMRTWHLIIVNVHLLVCWEVGLTEADVCVLPVCVQHVLLDNLHELVHPLGRCLRSVGEGLSPTVHGGQGPLEGSRSPGSLSVVSRWGRGEPRCLWGWVGRGCVRVIRAEGGRGEQRALAGLDLVQCADRRALGSGRVASSTGSGQSRVSRGGCETSGHIKRHVGTSEELKIWRLFS